MKWVKCVNTQTQLKNLSIIIDLTYGKIYQVRSSRFSDWSNKLYGKILSDNGEEVEYDISDTLWFEDATADIREEKLKELGI